MLGGILILTIFPQKREKFEKLVGFDFLREQLEPKTPYGVKYFKHIQPFGYEHLIEHLEDIDMMIDFLKKYPKIFEDVEHDFECVLDVSHTVEKLSTGSILDEIEFFQLKNFLLVSQSIREKFKHILPEKFLPPNLNHLIDILDPEGLRLTTFYVYDVYDERLAEVRKRKIELIKKQDGSLDEEVQSLAMLERQIEEEVLAKLSVALSAHSGLIETATEKVKYLDVLIAKAKLTLKFNLSKPIVKKPDAKMFEEYAKIKIQGMFNPKLKATIEREGGSYQPVDIVVEPCVTVIVGANMSGKSVTLRTVALIEYMVHFGFFVPCVYCETPLLNALALVTEDQSEPLGGLSSFATEMKEIDTIYRYVKGGNTPALVLLDEPARTTNPYEATVIINALSEIFERLKVHTLIVTHFDDVRSRKRLRVKGLRAEKLGNVISKDTLERLHEFMDYTLVEVGQDETVPREALKVMEYLCIDEDIINTTKMKIKDERRRSK
uniref:DNA mismatch repair protein MutS n=1 Tax=Fervidobacterium thailandense TaxID=1008305 RepID=A0A7C4CCV3_9BACT